MSLKTIIGPVFRFGAKVVFVVLVLPILYILEPFYRVRLGIMKTQRIGHLAANTDAFLRRQQLNGTPKRTLYLFFGYDPANRQLFTMYQRHLNIFYSRWGTRLLFAWRPILWHTRFWEPFDWATNLYSLMNSTKATLSFTENEEIKGKALLADMGIGEGDWFVCFHSRDDAYFRQWRPELNDIWDKVQFKNSSVENYLKAAEYITSLGGYAIRMGAAVDAPMPETGNPKIIDYATRHRSDFMDIYLSAKCRFFLASNSGLCMVPLVFDVPVAVANHTDFTFPFYHSYDLFIPRLIRSKEVGRIISYPEATAAGFYGETRADYLARDYHTFDFEWVEHDADDILDLTKDMTESLNGGTASPDTQRLQLLYGERYLSRNPDYLHGAKVGLRFARKYYHLLFPQEGGEK